jgi:hypothetical protein
MKCRPNLGQHPGPPRLSIEAARQARRSASWDGHDRRDEVGQQETSSSDRDQINCPAVAHYVEISGVLLVSICPKAYSGRPKHLRVIQAGRREAVPVDRSSRGSFFTSAADSDVRSRRQ